MTFSTIIMLPGLGLPQSMPWQSAHGSAQDFLIGCDVQNHAQFPLTVTGTDAKPESSHSGLDAAGSVVHGTRLRSPGHLAVVLHDNSLFFISRLR